jgi:hypothetical protein
MSRLTKFSSFLNSNDYLTFKSIFSKTYFISFFNRFYLLHKNYENNYYSFFNNKIKNDFQIFHKNSFFKKQFNLYTFRANSLTKIKNNINDFNFILSFYFSPLIFKYLSYLNQPFDNKKNYKNFSLIKNISFLKDFFFNTSNLQISFNNLLPNSEFSYIFKKKMLKIFNYSKFPIVTTI